MLLFKISVSITDVMFLRSSKKKGFLLIFGLVFFGIIAFALGSLDELNLLGLSLGLLIVFH